MAVQHVEPEVSRLKFNREIQEFRGLSREYCQRGWFLADAEFPTALIVLATPKTKPASIVMGVLFDYTNYDAMPPSVRIVNPFTREPYKSKDLPNPLNRALAQQEVAIPGGQGSMVLQNLQAYMQGYGPEDIPFLCLAGVREYHEHPAHSGDSWELHRTSGAGRLVRLLDVIYRYGVAPIAGYSVQFQPQVKFNYGPPPA